MSASILIIGKSGSGKSRSIKTLNPKETFIINVMGKQLPFKEGVKNYKFIERTEKGIFGNLFVTDGAEDIKKTLTFISDKYKEIKTVIIDDFQYIMANEFMRRAREKGYEKFSEIGQNVWKILYETRNLRCDLTVIFLSHTETNDLGEIKIKTIGKMLDDKVCIEGMFSIVLHAIKVDKNHYFETQSNGSTTAKSPEGMFTDILIPNDLQYVLDCITRYNNIDIE